MAKVSEKTRRTVAGILTQFMFTRDMEDVMKVWDIIFQQYDLHLDPFTGTPCTENEYCHSLLEYEKQTMLLRYGHCDGLEG